MLIAALFFDNVMPLTLGTAGWERVARRSPNRKWGHFAAEEIQSGIELRRR